MLIDNLDNKTEGQAPNLDNPVNNDGGDDAAKIERYKQQIEGSRQEALAQRQERVNDWFEVLSEDVNSLKRLANVKDTKLVNEVLSKFNYSSIEEALVDNGLLDKKVNSDGMTKEELEKWYEERKAQDIHQIAIQEANKAFNDLTEDEKTVALKNFEKITKGKTLTIDEAKEYADMAAIYAIKDKVIKKGDQGKGLVNLAGLGSGNGGGGKGGKDLVDSIIDNW